MRMTRSWSCLRGSSKIYGGMTETRAEAARTEVRRVAAGDRARGQDRDETMPSGPARRGPARAAGEMIVARHSFLCPLRWSDVDVYGVVNNVAFVRYLEEARVDLFLCMPPGERESFLGQGSVVGRHEIDYKSQLAHRREPVEIEIWVSQLRAAT